MEIAGTGRLEIAADGAQSVIHSVWARPPLVLVPTKNHGHAAWVFQASLGGGFVDGDTSALAIEVGAGSAALLSTQSSTKVYASPSGCAQRVTASVGAGALLAVLPDPVVCYAAARFEQQSRITLAADASLVWLDAMTAGRSASGERWDFARYVSSLAVVSGGAVALQERIELDPLHGNLRERMGRYDAFATLVAVGPRARAIVADAPTLAARTTTSDKAMVASGAAPAGLDGVVVRFAATSTEALIRAVRAQLPGLASALGDDPFARKF